ncbi:UDP-galactopyranose mutase [Halpernia sp.]|uniref:UDP-galactopyranose mutase n=1 Tax=Halpernia sp. TaxID=2782209 RepID=UPI003A951466
MDKVNKFDFLIVGSGFFGAVCARELTDAGFKCCVIEKRKHIGGNAFTENIEGINVHRYGAHIFHTNHRPIWDYVNKFATFNRYTNSPVAIYKDKLYNLPFNMNTFYQLWETKTPEEAKMKIEDQIIESGIKNPQNLEEQAISLVGTDIYEKLIKGYTEKQWGRKATDLPSFIIKRLPVRFTYDNNYFNDLYQGIPIGGYTSLFENLLEGIEVILETDYFANRSNWNNSAKKVIYTGPLNLFFDNYYGELEYRSLYFEEILLNQQNFQGNAVINYTDIEVPYTRIIEHKHFEFGTQNKTVISKEFPKEWELGDEPYYPINNAINAEKYLKYRKLAELEKNTYFGGRLAEYRYYDMHQVIASALKLTKDIIQNFS